MRTISGVLIDLQRSLDGKNPTIHDLLIGLSERGIGFVLLIFALPMALPIPVPPGINIVLASPLVFLTAQQLLGRETLWLPKKIQEKVISHDTIISLNAKAIPLLKKAELLLKPRLGFLSEGLFFNCIGLLGFIMALSVCIPLPLTNTVPSLGIALMAMGLITRDGLAILLGALIGTLWVALLILSLYFFGEQGIAILKETIKTL